MFGNTANDLVYKISAKHQGGRRLALFYLFQALFILLGSLVAVWLFRLGPILHPASIQFGIPIGVSTFVLYILVLMSLTRGEVSTNITIFRLNFVVSSILAVLFLRETLTIRKIAGLVLCCGAIIVLFFATPRQDRAAHSGLLFSIPACILAGGVNILIKIAFNNGALIAQVILFRYLVVAFLATLLFLIRRKQGDQESNRKVYLLSLLSGTAMMFALYFTFAAYRIGDVALVTPINQLAFVFSSAGAVLLLKEKMSYIKVLAIILAVASIVTIA